jgi:hypothetical protein
MNFMKKLIAIFVVLSLVSCYKTFSNKQNFDKIEMNNVEKILIKKQLYDTLCVEFNQKENIKFIELINSSKKLESKIDKSNLQKIIDWNNRWNKK